MNDLYIRAFLAGLFFGVWPLLMNRSGLTGNVSSAAFALGALLVVSPFALYELHRTSPDVVWKMLISAAVFGGLGLLAFNGMLAKAPQQDVGRLFILMIVVQITIPAMYQVYQNGGLTASRGVGFAAALLAAFMLA